MMLLPFCCSMLKVSVATRGPRITIPNEPESTVCVDAGFALSFLSAPYAPADARQEAKISATAWRIDVSNFTRLLLVRCVARFLSSPASPLSRLRLFPLRGRQSESSQTPSSSHRGEPHTAREIAP